MLDADAFVLADLTIDPAGGVSIQPNRLTQAWRRVRERVPCAEDMRLHDVRHWYASTQLDAGEPLPAVTAGIGEHVESIVRDLTNVPEDFLKRVRTKADQRITDLESPDRS